MKIAFVIPQINAGGVETFIFRLSSFFQREGHDVTIVSTYDKGEWWGAESSNNLESECLAIKNSFSPLNHIFKIGNYFIKNHYDIILLNNDKYTQAALNMLPNRVIAIPIIHNDAAFAYQIGCSNSSAWNVAVGVSPKVLENIKNYTSDRPAAGIMYGVEMPDKELWRRREKHNRKIKLLFVGRIEHVQKGVLYLPDILKGCLKNGLDISLTIIGDGSDMDNLKHKIAEYNLWKHVSLCGLLPPEKIYNVLLSHHILLMPSFFEGLGIIALESQACGCVPIASKLEGITDHSIKDRKTGILVKPGDIGGIIKSILHLYHCPEDWTAMCNRGHLWVEKKFSIESMGQAYLKLFNDALDGCYPLPRPRRRYYPIDLLQLSWRDFVPNYLRKVKQKSLNK